MITRRAAELPIGIGLGCRPKPAEATIKCGSLAIKDIYVFKK